MSLPTIIQSAAEEKLHERFPAMNLGDVRMIQRSRHGFGTDSVSTGAARVSLAIGICTHKILTENEAVALWRNAVAERLARGERRSLPQKRAVSG